MKVEHLVILQLCFVFVLCARLSRKQLEQRIQAIQTLTMQDMQIIKEVVKNNAEGIKIINEGNQKKSKNIQKSEKRIENIELKLDDLSNIIKQSLSMGQNYNNPTATPRDVSISGASHDPKTKITPSDFKRLQRAFQDQKLYSMSLQAHAFNQIEKQDAFMKNISTHIANSKSKDSCDLSEHLVANIEKLASCTNTDQEKTTGPTSTEYRNILMKTETILKEVIKGRSVITDSLSAISHHNTDPGNKIAASCFKVVYAKEPDVVENNEHECLNISAHRGKKITFHCGNRNVRLGDAKITEVAVEGRVEVRYNNHWGTVCSDSFDEREASVVCRGAGFARGVVENRVPDGSGQIWLDDLSCNGDENDMFACDRPSGIGAHNCVHSEDAGVRCFWLP